MYKMLFTPFKIGNVEVKNRLVMSPMGTGLANLDGTPTEDMMVWYEERARGGCGMIYTEVCRVNDATGAAMTRQLSLTRDRNIVPVAEMVSRVHQYGTKMFCQLHHPGRETYTALLGGQPCVGASDRMCLVQKEPTRALTTDEVKGLVQDYVATAVRAQKAGFDGVEIHCAHGYLPGQFFSPYTNNRTDEYGGSFENRMRFAVEILHGIQAACGKDYPVTFRISADEMLDMVGVTEPHIRWQDGVEISKALEKAGASAINVSCGIYETGTTVIEPTTFEQGWRTYFIKPIKEAISIPVIAVNNIREPQLAEKLLEDGVQDFIAMGRTWIAEPHWGTKVMEGREDDIRKCIGCLRCFESLSTNAAKNRPGECSVNPKAFKERLYRDEVRDAQHHRVAVIGGGPAGMSAALTCAQRGMDVTLYEKSAKLGGLLHYASAAPHKERMNWLTEYYEKALPAAGVKVLLGTEATVPALEALKPDAIIVAAGAKPIVPNVPGRDGKNVFGIFDVLDGRSGLENKKVVVVGAGITGLECASYLNAKGCSTTIVDMLDAVAPTGNFYIVADDMMRLKKAGTTVVLKHQLQEITDKGIVVKDLDTQEIKTMECDAVVLSLGITPENGMVDELKAKFENVYTVGGVEDAGGMIHGATNSAYRCARALFAGKPAPSFKVDEASIPKFVSSLNMFNQEGVVAAYLTDPDAIERILPPPLKPFALPVVTFSLYKVGNPNFTEPYYEATLGVYCMLNGQPGLYPVSLLLCGPGQESAQLAGREIAAWPKKIADSCVVTKEQDGCYTASVSRHGTEVMRVRMKPGMYNHGMMHALYQAPAPGKDTMGIAYCYKMDMVINAQGKYDMANCRVLGNVCKYHYNSWQPCFVESMEVRSSEDDPWASLPVTTLIGGAYGSNDLYLNGSLMMALPDVKEALPYIMTQRYDRDLYGEVDRL
jgi:2,4-dienoyl-CoA reductase-like NADH-dependent reductase (Old Yellow Enzyme family)/thioredoxin reductase